MKTDALSYTLPVNQHEETKSKAPFESSSDLDIWNAFRQGNEGAFNHIYQTYFGELLGFGYRFTTNRELIKDTIQDLFIELRESGMGLSPTTSIKYYLYKSFRYKIIRYLSKSPKEVTIDSTTNKHGFDIVLSHETILINQQISEEKASLMQKAFDTLTKRQKEALFYFYYENMSYQQVAEIMGLYSVKSARNLIYKSLTVLKKEIALHCFTLLIIIGGLIYFFKNL